MDVCSLTRANSEIELKPAAIYDTGMQMFFKKIHKHDTQRSASIIQLERL